MIVRAKIYGLLGDAGYMASGAFVMYLHYLEKVFKDQIEVQTFADSGRDTSHISTDIISQRPGTKIILIGYSLGANGCAWAQNALPVYSRAHAMAVRYIDLIVGFDPTKNGPSLEHYPIAAHVKRCLLFQQMDWWWPTSMFFGRGAYVRTANGPKIEVTQCHEDHSVVQADFRLQDICTAAIRQIVQPHISDAFLHSVSP